MAMHHPDNRAGTVVDVLFGHRVEDPYRWLEDGNHPDVITWTAAQARYTEWMLMQYKGRGERRERLTRISQQPEVGLPCGRGNTLVFQYRNHGQNQPVLYACRHRRRWTVVDPNTSAPDGLEAVDWQDVSQDGRYVLFGLSSHGDEWSTLHLYDLDAQRLLDDRIPRARQATVAFPAQSAGFFYTRYPLPGTVPEGNEFFHVSVYYHRLGTPYTEDSEIFRVDDDKRAIPRLLLSPDGGYLLIRVSYGWTRDRLHVLNLREASSQPRLLLDLGEATVLPFWHGSRLMALTNAAADGGQIIEIRLSDGRYHTVIPETPHQPIIDAAATAHHLFLHVLDQAASKILALSPQGRLQRVIALPGYAGVTGIFATHDALFYRYESFGIPPTVHAIRDTTLDDRVWMESAPADNRIRVLRDWATAPDGTRIPVYIAMGSDWTRDHPRPLVLSGYGGFNVPFLPRYAPSVYDWIRSGRLYAQAVVRGGGEFGASWHRQGMREHKETVFDDFASVAHHLIQHGYTDPNHLGISGRSNGGLLAAAFLTRHPELAAAVVMGVPLCDMIRYPRFLLAALWTAEYGCPDRPDEFEWLWRYSPYHHVIPGRAYPAVLIYSSTEDSRVDPLHARKMVARLQDATASGQPVLLRMALKQGHGTGQSLTQWIAEETDIWTFLDHHLS
ncbi:MAG: prolyl oligopeptidase family serine peptidase [Firmicutes bacterium]|nr:prolyl oligopeptidase family serine peptidase [Bacillota bacterium]